MRPVYLIFFLFLCCFLFSQKRQYKSVQIDEKISIDGIIDDIWNKADFHSDFLVEEPYPLQKPTEKTEFKVLYDSENIYFLIKSYQNKETIIAQSGKRESNIFDGDNIQIFLDPNHDKTTGYAFVVTASNKQMDRTMFNDVNSSTAWDAIWDSQVKIYDDYWITEVKLPFRILKFQNKETQTWGLNVERYIKRKGEWSQWQVFTPETGTRVSAIGELVDLQGLEVKQELNILPSLLSTFDSDSDYDPSKNQIWGLNLRYNIDQQNSIVGTLKPDFAQIETDQDVINYSDYPTSLPEKRPFFLEGNNIYFTHDDLYYTRRMVKPDLGIKFLGNSENIQYGLFFVRNDGFSSNVEQITERLGTRNVFDTTYIDKHHKEDFLFTRLKYVEGDNYEFGYLGQFVKSDVELSGQLHAFDATYRPDKNFRFQTLFATTTIDDNVVYTNSNATKNNFNAFLSATYKDDWWDGFIRYQDKTEYFEQALAGLPRPNNSSNRLFFVSRKFRYKKQDLQQISIGYNLLQNSTYGNSVKLINHDFSIEFQFQFKRFGRITINPSIAIFKGQVRQYSFDSSTNLKPVYSDNIGQFIGIDENGSAKGIGVRTDRSKSLSISMEFVDSEVKQSDVKEWSFSSNYKVNYNMQISLGINYVGIAGSQYLNRVFFRSFSLKIEQTILNNLFVKTYSQYNTQSQILSNNLVFTYEYIRGSFLYLSYNDAGIIWDNNEFNQGSLIKNYQLNQRTISFKWTHSLYL